MADCKPVGTPILPGSKLSKSQSPITIEEKADMDRIPYINAIGSLLYLATISHPDIAYIAGVLARFNTNPGKIHWKAVKHVFRYLKGTVDLKLQYGPNVKQNGLFEAYTDADLGGNIDNGKSTSGYLIQMGLGVVCWSSKLQPAVALSTTEAELMAGVAGGKEVNWLQNLLVEIGYKAPIPAILYTDNKSAIQVSKNPEHHGRMKHLNLHFSWLRDQVQKERILLVYTETTEMPETY